MATKYSKGSGNLQRDLNHALPAFSVARLGDRLNDLTNTVNLLTAQNTLLLSVLTAGVGAVIPSLTTVNALAVPVALTPLATPYPRAIPGDIP